MIELLVEGVEVGEGGETGEEVIGRETGFKLGRGDATDRLTSFKFIWTEGLAGVCFFIGSEAVGYGVGIISDFKGRAGLVD